MKQEEARTKWCPMSRRIVDAVGVSVGSANRTEDGEFLFGCTCLASDCMMWMWLSKEEGLGGLWAGSGINFCRIPQR